MKKNISLVMLILCFTIFMSLSTSAQDASKPTVLKLGCGITSIFKMAADKFAELTKEATNGEVIIEVFPDETLGTPTEMAAALNAGALDLFVGSLARYGNYYKPITVLDAFFMFEDWDHLRRFMGTEMFSDLISGLEDEVGIHVLASMYYSSRLFWTNKPVLTPEDMVGLKLRVPNEPMPVAMIEILGGSPTPITFGETYLALRQGVVDGMENGATTALNINIHEVTDYINITNHQIQTNSLLMSGVARNKLSDEEFEIIKKAAKQACEEATVIVLEDAQKDFDFLAQHMTVIETEKEKFAEACQDAYVQFEDNWGEGVWEYIQSLR